MKAKADQNAAKGREEEKRLEFDRRTTKTLFALVAFGVLGFWVLENFKAVCSVLGGILGPFSPFVVGAAIAFILNVPMRALDGGCFPRWARMGSSRFARPVSAAAVPSGRAGDHWGGAFLVIPEVMRTFRTIGEGIPHSAQFPVPVGQPV